MYSYPSMVKPNMRSRGPMESEKVNRATQAVVTSLKQLKAKVQKLQGDLQTLQASLQTSGTTLAQQGAAITQQIQQMESEW